MENKSTERFEVNEAFLHILDKITHPADDGGSGRAAAADRSAAATADSRTMDSIARYAIGKLDKRDLLSKSLPCLPFSIGTMNRLIGQGQSATLVAIAEYLHNRALMVYADIIVQRGVKVVLVAGPSSSGKTTFSRKLADMLRSMGKTTHVVSLDDYFVSRERTPKDENGEYDYESIYAEDIPLFQSQLATLLAGGEVELPRYNFMTGMSEKSGQRLRLGDDSMLVIEGIHGLNPILTGSIPDDQLFRIYISALTVCKQPDGSYFPTTDNRLVRRIVRDAKYRNATAEATLARWPSVRRGEQQWIVPFQQNADVNFNSAFQYELALLKSQALPLLYNVGTGTPQYADAQRLIAVLEDFEAIDESLLPGTSLLREFIGGSQFGQ